MNLLVETFIGSRLRANVRSEDRICRLNPEFPLCWNILTKSREIKFIFTNNNNDIVQLKQGECELFRLAFNDAAIGMAFVALDGRWLKVRGEGEMGRGGEGEMGRAGEGDKEIRGQG